MIGTSAAGIVAAIIAVIIFSSSFLFGNACSFFLSCDLGVSFCDSLVNCTIEVAQCFLDFIYAGDRIDMIEILVDLDRVGAQILPVNIVTLVHLL